jgi:4-hydroxybenzoate polyprenyltransferase
MMHFLNLIRWKNLLIILFTQTLVYFFLRPEPSLSAASDPGFLMLLFSTLLLAAAGYLINDYSDIKIDVINKPEGLIVSRFISPRLTLLLHIIFNLIAVGIGFYLDFRLGIVNLLTAWLLWRYSASYKYKLVIGNLIVALLMALSLIVVYFPFHYLLFNWLLFYSCFAFLTGFAREIIKDVEDMEGDEAYNCRTIPIVFGIYKTKLVLMYIVLIMIFMLIFVIAYFIHWRVIIFPVYLAIFVFLPMIEILFLLKKADTKKVFSKLSTRMKIIMLLGALSMGLRCFI